MSNVETIDRKEDGFELAGRFYRWSITDTGKDLLLVDRFTGMPVTAFFEMLESEDGFDRGRAPNLLALIATSLRAGHPDWSVERIVRLVHSTPLSEVEFIDADAEEQQVPPAEGGKTPPNRSPRQPSVSSLSSTPTGS